MIITCSIYFIGCRRLDCFEGYSIFLLRNQSVARNMVKSYRQRWTSLIEIKFIFLLKFIESNSYFYLKKFFKIESPNRKLFPKYNKRFFENLKKKYFIIFSAQHFCCC